MTSGRYPSVPECRAWAPSTTLMVQKSFIFKLNTNLTKQQQERLSGNKQLPTSTVLGGFTFGNPRWGHYISSTILGAPRICSWLCWLKVTMNLWTPLQCDDGHATLFQKGHSSSPCKANDFPIFSLRQENPSNHSVSWVWMDIWTAYRFTKQECLPSSRPRFYIYSVVGSVHDDYNDETINNNDNEDDCRITWGVDTPGALWRKLFADWNISIFPCWQQCEVASWHNFGVHTTLRCNPAVVEKMRQRALPAITSLCFKRIYQHLQVREVMAGSIETIKTETIEQSQRYLA